MKAHTGDWIVVEPLHVGEHRRRGLVLDVRGPDGGPPYLVRWSVSDQRAGQPGTPTVVHRPKRTETPHRRLPR